MSIKLFFISAVIAIADGNCTIASEPFAMMDLTGAIDHSALNWHIIFKLENDRFVFRGHHCDLKTVLNNYPDHEYIDVVLHNGIEYYNANIRAYKKHMVINGGAS
jgi:hypothetical protein